MSDEDLNEAGKEGADENGKSGLNARKIILFVVLPLLLLVGVGGGLYMTGFLDPYLGKTEECVEEVDEHGAVTKACPAEEAHAEEKGGHGAAASSGGGHGAPSGGHGGEGGGSQFIEIPTMIVNLNDEDGTPRYLRLSVQLELKNPADAPSIEAVMPRVVDQFQTYLRELRVRDLRGSAGIYRLQMELLWRVNQAASPIEVKDVLFQEILIQ